MLNLALSSSWEQFFNNGRATKVKMRFERVQEYQEIVTFRDLSQKFLKFITFS